MEKKNWKKKIFERKKILRKKIWKKKLQKKIWKKKIEEKISNLIIRNFIFDIGKTFSLNSKFRTQDKPV